MALRQLRYEGDEILRKRCKKVEEVDDHIRMILDDMLDTLHNTEDGAAIAAPQVGILKRLVVIDMGTGIIKLVNPEIIEEKGIQECVEGCLSIPNKYGNTIRPKKVTIKALNENGEEIILTGRGEMAKCFCHEIDHLDGILFIDKVTKWLKLKDK
ncbi:peptide deformylase [Clostridium sp. 1001271B_151109_B4]|uniref:peptide deformylase n=1 Tax=Clostridium sp. 1001271B_151109_B4 TaxID=2787148 RepID=UPI0018A982DB|nr:peptide deformylase [Clostridium sp. 1001271B_151109_B4]